ncbi:redoxin domain-containing protein [Oscillatoriales cyanobacterium LEGE 11467]|uniref:thioredoxin-dependent peroxiredoxin n=1 Tax=Zarconia navalis LEGE 11467 TaxID=1828826 RepID=A0A928Z7A2_9CYAN|nr:redoxin domain-containing protein [Zarconia navalis]MBE9041242.1 redoxin domain-containing protein [Zarconia navalis LEGE 11467]
MSLSTRTLSIGDRIPLFGLLDRTGDRFILSDNAGKPAIVFFYAQDEMPGCQEVAIAFRDLKPECDEANVQIYSISLDRPESRHAFGEQQDISYTLLCDTNRAVSKLYGVCRPSDDEKGDWIYARAAFLIDTNLRILQIYHLGELETAIDRIRTDIHTLIRREEPRHMTMQAPVLLIPNVLDKEFCQDLIRLWQTDNGDSGFMKREGDRTVGYIDYTHKIRRDHFVGDRKILRRLVSIVQRRVFTEIKRAFQFEATRWESFRIGSYDSSRGGFFRAHRDDTTGGTAHRRFAMTLNLNAGEYEGGFLRFPEHGPHLYKPDTGSAVIFSGSVMHEATDITAGERFVLLSFFYGEKEAEQRKAYEERAKNDYQDIITVEK